MTHNLTATPDGLPPLGEVIRTEAGPVWTDRPAR